ncbi:chondroitinase family polysaccharide lyase [Coprobacter tertius]|uniref:Polysaccharide lyase beta-sandwich domain-containing protein n=1 Tax=Coprobacter tertius TaxID=2944915 RepID=A0ABT1MIT3_9BACT|nr:chondroitinase family polysaccharide lyase [Coprobacter tertius]MCP9612525.1 polysaccharide lyase beta-sandwich domain-containing protein [Coprobacter tertius]
MKFNCILIFLLIVLSTVESNAQIKEFTHPEILSFETSTLPAKPGKGSEITISNLHYKHLAHSLQWRWNQPNSIIEIDQPIKYLSKNPNPNETSVSTFVFWVYNPRNLPGGKIRFEFLKKGKICSYFDYGTDFSGWRGAWIAFDRDMQGKPEEGMDCLRIIAPDIENGELFFDHIILSSFQDIRHHTASFEAPYVNPSTTSHWLILLKSWQNRFDIPVKATISPEEQKSIKTVEQRLHELLLPNKKIGFDKLIKQYNAYNITQNPDGTVKGVPVFFERFGETYNHLGGINYAKIYDNPMGLRKFNTLLYNIAITYNNSDDIHEKNKLEHMYIMLIRHMLDQGFQAGSALGTLHHLGYSMRNFYPAAFLMKNVLKNAGLDIQVQQAMEWFAGTGEVKLKPRKPGMDIDAFNTSLIGRLSSILMMNDSPEKVSYLYSISRWINNGLLPSDGTEGCFKIDGTIFHHRHNYPAYAVGGLDGAVNSVWLLHKTMFSISPESHEQLKFSLLTMRKYCNLLSWPLSLSGRHPDGKGHIFPWHYGRLAIVGSPDGKYKIDPELAAAYLRLLYHKKGEYSDELSREGFKAEPAPEGNWSLNYSCLAVHRRGEWLATAMGFSRYLWSTEGYIGANCFGRYLNHGNLQILGTGNPIDIFQSGFNQKGWDWNHIPGTTAAVLPMEKLKADVRQVDSVSGYEEMLLSDESFAGSVSNGNRNGVFGMKLHENDKYNGSLHARKSYFFFDNRIIALGTGIKSVLRNAPVHTTLFQVYLADKNIPIHVNGKKITNFPYHKRLKEKSTVLCDSKNNYYFVYNADIIIHKDLQHSLDEETCLPTQNNFAMAAINHGNSPENENYRYMVLIQPNEKELSEYIRNKDSQDTMPYTVLQQNDNAHIVTDKITKTTGYVLFESGIINKADIISTNHPCLAMTKSISDNELILSVCDPDLKFYDGPADEIYDKNGKTIERSIYSRKWINNPSGISTIEVTIKGIWEISGNSEDVHIKTHQKDNTVFEISCQNGLTREVKLMRKELNDN